MSEELIVFHFYEMSPSLSVLFDETKKLYADFDCLGANGCFLTAFLILFCFMKDSRFDYRRLGSNEKEDDSDIVYYL